MYSPTSTPTPTPPPIPEISVPCAMRRHSASSDQGSRRTGVQLNTSKHKAAGSFQAKKLLFGDHGLQIVHPGTNTRTARHGARAR